MPIVTLRAAVNPRHGGEPPEGARHRVATVCFHGLVKTKNEINQPLEEGSGKEHRADQKVR